MKFLDKQVAHFTNQQVNGRRTFVGSEKSGNLPPAKKAKTTERTAMMMTDTMQIDGK